ncbi:terminase TerL endonuclease subunit [Oenococcus sp.]|uniref:terminase TerL endonuclease subunit n=1 Tax=Oenococcus sp. TaxID=1979414 RepID=UPI0039EB0F87
MIDDVTQYAKDVQEHRILSGEPMLISTKRHLNDLQKSKLAVYNYYFDQDELNRVMTFAKFVPDPDLGVPTPLLGFQKFTIGSLMAWKSKSNGMVRFHKAAVTMAKSNGKTYIAAIILAYDFWIRNAKSNNQDDLIASNVSDQTTKLYNYVSGTIQQIKDKYLTDDPVAYDDLIVNTEQTRFDSKKNVIRKMTALGSNVNSFHATVGIFDEAGMQKTRFYFDKIQNGQILKPNALFLMISTAYEDPNVPLREDIDSVLQSIKNDDGKNDDYFLAVWTQDDKSEIFKPETWIKSNPLLGLPKLKDVLLSNLISQRNLHANSGTLNDFMVYNMNMWLNAKQDAAFNLDEYKATTIKSFNFNHRDVYIGFDNSMTSDDGAFGFIFPYVPKKFFIYQHSFVPWHKAGSIEAKESQDGINYRHMQELGFASITKHKKGLISQDQEYEWLMDFVSEHDLNVLGFLYDKFHNSALIQSIADNTNWPMIPVRQGAISLNAPTKFLQDSFVDGRVTHLDDPMMEASLMNAVIVTDGNNGIKIDKQRATLKIDLVDAIVDGFYQGMYHFEDFANKDDPEAEFARMTDNQKHDFLMGDFSF